MKTPTTVADQFFLTLLICVCNIYTVIFFKFSPDEIKQKSSTCCYFALQKRVYIHDLAWVSDSHLGRSGSLKLSLVEFWLSD